MRYVIIGTGPAGTYAAQTIRDHDSEGEITVISDEGREFYVREHLHRYLAGRESEADLFEKGARFSLTIGASFVNARVTDADPDRKTLTTADGQKISFDKLLIAAGAKPRGLEVPGSDLRGVHTFYSLAEAEKVQAALRDAGNIVLIGGGTIALQLIPVLLEQGKKVTVVERLSGIMARILDEEAAGLLEKELRERGVRILTEEEVTNLREPAVP